MNKRRKQKVLGYRQIGSSECRARTAIFRADVSDLRFSVLFHTLAQVLKNWGKVCRTFTSWTADRKRNDLLMTTCCTRRRKEKEHEGVIIRRLLSNRPKTLLADGRRTTKIGWGCIRYDACSYVYVSSKEDDWIFNRFVKAQKFPFTCLRVTLHLYPAAVANLSIERMDQVKEREEKRCI